MEKNLERFIKTPAQINTMREGGKILASMLNDIYSMVLPGKDVWELEQYFINQCSRYNVLPSCKGYAPMHMNPFPTGLCLSINNQSVHCFPKKGVIIKDNDLVTVDTVIKYKGLHVDSAFAKYLGSDKQSLNLVATAKSVLTNALNLVSEGTRIGDLSEIMENTALNAGFNVLRDFAGHGIGSEMHEKPEIMCYGKKGNGPVLLKNLTICVEALVCEGDSDVVFLNDWETRMKDNKRFLQFEHTVLVTENGYEILTKTD